MKVSIALFRYRDHPEWERPTWVYAQGSEPSSDMVRVSDWTEVELALLPEEDVLAARIAGLDAEHASVVKEFQERLQKLADAKAKLLALPAPSRQVEREAAA